uniref:Receptor L-domain domain-containing protein n=1 Tax=Panagrellus redivivus TaxID=6233 RepID=A0A7E4USZ9_PANRE
MPAFWAILLLSLFGIVFGGANDNGQRCLRTVLAFQGASNSDVESFLTDDVAIMKFSANAAFQLKMFELPEIFRLFCADATASNEVCNNNAACAFLAGLEFTRKDLFTDPQFLQNYPENNMLLIDNDYTAADEVVLKQVFTPTTTFGIIASDEELLTNLMSNADIIKAIVGKKATFKNVMEHKDFMAALEKNEKLRAKLISGVNAMDALTKFFDKHKPIELARLIFDSNDELKGAVKLIFLTPMIIVLVCTVFTLIMMWAACYPWRLIQKPGEPDIDEEPKDKKKDKKDKKDKGDKTGDEKTNDEDEKTKKKNKDSDKDKKKGSSKEEKKDSKDKDKKKKKGKKDEEEEEEEDDKKKKKDKKGKKKGKKDDDDE